MEEFRDRYIQQCGSSTVEPAFKATCDRVTDLMAEKFSIHIYPSGNIQQVQGDSFGRLYIGGFKKLSDCSEVVPITAAKYLDIFLTNLKDLGLDEKTISEFDQLCLDYLITLRSPTREIDAAEIRDL